MNTFTVIIFELNQKDGRRFSPTMGNILNESFLIIFDNEVTNSSRKRELYGKPDAITESYQIDWGTACNLGSHVSKR